MRRGKSSDPLFQITPLRARGVRATALQGECCRKLDIDPSNCRDGQRSYVLQRHGTVPAM